MADDRVGGVVEALPMPRDATVMALFRVHYSDLVRLARFLVDDHETAEDIVQEAFVGLHRRWRALDDHHAALGYLRAAVVNGSRSTLRRRDVRRRQAATEATLVPSAESLAMHGEELRAVRDVLRKLPERQRQVVVLRYYLDLSEAEISSMLGISRGSVKSHCSRGLASMARRLEPAR